MIDSKWDWKTIKEISADKKRRQTSRNWAIRGISASVNGVVTSRSC
ncbi:hypothetical protein Sulac_0779 [Sulfobacillus acidophilus DSM 10332]|uniref:Uncharacterized protein n=1 Tax=Sulfobacillus acidophilus (strain ATCC 700253 / DSM 10332 / NAL) TaxID=679936 RepID=G8U150_SULAD|nr:hypothetical protein Sulac_0779 [Sulfobacillus acidophilus DSM 10332]